MTHPVVDLVRARVMGGSAPGARTDAAVLGLCIEGGAMRGVVSAGMISAVEQLGLLPAFDIVIGCSAGAANAAYLVAGVGTLGSTIYYEKINNRSFIDARRLLLGKPVVSLEFLVGDVMVRRTPLDVAAILVSPVRLAIVASNVDTGETDLFADFADGADVLGSIRASAAMPILAGPPWAHRGKRYWDGSLTEPIPLDTAVKLGCTHVVTLLTRPCNVTRPSLSLFQRHVILPRMRRESPALAERFSRQREDYEAVLARLEAQGGGRDPRVLTLRPAGPPVGNLERRRPVLVEGAQQGFRAVAEAFDGIAHAALARSDQHD
jgi:predicted patatin/cPLA2 family phospholipase